MNKSVIIHGAWALVAIAAFAFGQIGKSPSANRDTAGDANSGSSSDRTGSVSALPGSSKGSTKANGVASTSGRPSPNGDIGLSASQVEAFSTTAFSDPNPLNRSLAFSKMLEGLTAENAELMLQTLKDGEASRDQWRLFLYAWGNKDGAGAMEYAASNLEGDRLSHFQNEALSGWASQNPTEAIAWADTIEDEEQRRRMNYSLIGGIADHDIGMATDYTFELAAAGDTNASRYLDTVASEQLRKEGIDGAIVWAEGLTDGSLKGSALDRVAGSYVNKDPEAAAAWAAQFASADYGARVIEEIGDEWAERNPEASVGWLSTLPEGDGRNQGTYSAFREWAQRDAMAASEHLATMENSPARDHAVSGLARTIAGRDPESAIAWADSISEPEMRTSTLTRTAQEWFRRDRTAVTEWLPTSGLSTEAQEQILNPPRDERGRRRG